MRRGARLDELSREEVRDVVRWIVRVKGGEEYGEAEYEREWREFQEFKRRKGLQ